MKREVAIATLGMILLVPLWGRAVPAERELAVTLDDLPVVDEEDLVRAKECNLPAPRPHDVRVLAMSCRFWGMTCGFWA